MFLEFSQVQIIAKTNLENWYNLEDWYYKGLEH